MSSPVQYIRTQPSVRARYSMCELCDGNVICTEGSNFSYAIFRRKHTHHARGLNSCLATLLRCKELTNAWHDTSVGVPLTHFDLQSSYNSHFSFREQARLYALSCSTIGYTAAVTQDPFLFPLSEHKLASRNITRQRVQLSNLPRQRTHLTFFSVCPAADSAVLVVRVLAPVRPDIADLRPPTANYRPRV